MQCARAATFLEVKRVPIMSHPLIISSRCSTGQVQGLFHRALCPASQHATSPGDGTGDKGEQHQRADERGARLERAAGAPRAHPRRDDRARLAGRLRRRPDARRRRAGRRRPRHAVPLLPLQDPPARHRAGARVRARREGAGHQDDPGRHARRPGDHRASPYDPRTAGRPAPHRRADPRVHVRRQVGRPGDPRRSACC